uniref:Uncharacterized protein n=1 Tax=Rhizophora mucronata TaxID=61149 RepID=A0A2P2NWA8_RHIMU
MRTRIALLQAANKVVLSSKSCVIAKHSMVMQQLCKGVHDPNMRQGQNNMRLKHEKTLTKMK